MLQASDKMRVHIREPNQLDQPNQRHIGRGLHALEQWPDPIVLLVLFMQGRLTCQCQERVEAGRPYSHANTCSSNLCVCHGMLRLSCC